MGNSEPWAPCLMPQGEPQGPAEGKEPHGHLRMGVSRPKEGSGICMARRPLRPTSYSELRSMTLGL